MPRPKGRLPEAVDFKKDVVADDFAGKMAASDDEGANEEVDGEGLLDQNEEAAVTDYDIERSAKGILDVPMEIASPIESEDEELLLDTSDELGGRRAKVERGDAGDSRQTEKECENDANELSEQQEGGASGRRPGRASGSIEHNESTSSVQIDPSYQPDTEELLYEGDVETEARLARAESAHGEDGDQRDDCFVFDVTGDNMELDEHPLEQPVKDKSGAAQGTALPLAPPTSEAQGAGGTLDQERFVYHFLTLSFPPECLVDFLKCMAERTSKRHVCQPSYL